MADDVLRLMAASLKDVFWIATSDLSSVQYITPSVETVWGLSSEQVLREARCLLDAIHPDDRERIRHAPTNEIDREYRVIRADGAVRWIRERGHALHDMGSDRTAYACWAHDVTDRKQAENERDVIAERFELLGRTTNEGMWDWDIVANTAWWSEALYTVFGHPRSMEPSYAAWADRIHPDDRARVLAGFDQAVKRGEASWSDEYRWVRTDGTIMEVSDRAYVLFDSNRKPTRMVGAVKDITQQRALERQLRHAQKMEAVGQLAGGITHDFNNILMAVALELALLKRAPGLSANALQHASEIRAALDRAKSLTRQLLVFSRREAMRPQVIDLNEKVVDLARMLRRLLGEQISLEFDLAPGALRANVDASMIDQVLLNLAVNGRDAMGRKGRLAIATSLHHARKPGAGTHGKYACIAVTDNGCGISDEDLPRIFDPFFTTKRSNGTGLGLATARGIVEQHDGWIGVKSELHRGTTFRVYIPASEGAVVNVVEPPTTVSLQGRERVLVVEDDASVRRGLRVLLEVHGYTVFEAESGVAALDIWDEHAGGFDLVVTDIMMPGGINGRELADHLVAKSSPVRLIFITGHGRDLASASPYPIIQKPVDPDQLMAIIRTELDR